MSLRGYEFQSDRAKKYAEEGRKQGLNEGVREGQKKLLSKLLAEKFGALPDGILQRIRDADDAQVERWAGRVLVEQTLDAVFAD